MEVAEAFSLISSAIDNGHCAHGYLIVGDVGGNCMELCDRILMKLFPSAREQVEQRVHPDVAWLEPEGAKRIITVGSMRDRIVEPLSVTSFSGGWKVGVIVGADRMEAPGANALLKSLEEPPPRTMYLLLTDQPDAMLPTIVSRSQRVDLKLSDGVLVGEMFEAIAEAFAAKDGNRLAELLTELKQDSDVPLVRKAFFRTIMSFVRKLMLSGKIPRYRAFRNVEAVEDAYRQSERSINDEAVLSFMMDRIVLP